VHCALMLLVGLEPAFLQIGTAEILADRLPETILACRTGLLSYPNNAQLRENLDYARAQVNYPPSGRGQPESEDWPPWLYQPSPMQSLLAALALLTIGCLLFTRWLMTQRSVLLGRAIVFLVLALVGGLLWIRLENRLRYEEQYSVVVIAEDHLPFLKGNGLSYPRHADLANLARGMEARKLLERGDWLQIRFASGEVGWVPHAAVLVDEP
jgi:hypothetical protein